MSNTDGEHPPNNQMAAGGNAAQENDAGANIGDNNPPFGPNIFTMPVAPTISLPQYKAFTFLEAEDVASRWEEWIDGLEVMMAAMRITDDSHQRSLLLHYSGSETRRLVKQLTATVNTYTELKTALDTYFAPKRNRVFLMHQLHQLEQLKGETVDSFHVRIREQVSKLNMHGLTPPEFEKLLTLSQLVNHCSNSQLRKKAIRDAVTLDTFLNLARAQEAAESQVKEIEKTSDVSSVQRRSGRRFDRSKSRKPAERSKSFGKKHTQDSERKSERKKSEKTCYRCGAAFVSGHMKTCPAMGKQCGKCNKVGHFASVCMSKASVHQTRATAEFYDSGDESSSIGYIDVNHVASTINNATASTASLHDVHISMYGSKFDFCVDTGAEVNIMNEHCFNCLPRNKVKLLKPPLKLYPYGHKDPLNVLGVFRTKLLLKQGSKVHSVYTDIYVVKAQGQKNLLSCKTSEELGIVKFMVNHVDANVKQVTSPYKEIVQEYKDVFTGLGCMKDVSVKLHIDETVTPVAQNCRRTPFHMREKLGEELDRLEKLGVIEKVEDSPTPWISPLTIVPKKSGIRVCLDSRAINEAIMRERHPMPTINDLMVDLNGCSWFSKIDLNQGYNQLELNPDSRYITTFTTFKGLYRYSRLCFGLNSAAEIFQKAVADMLRDIPGVLNISDDCLIFSKTEQEHIDTVKTVLERLREKNVTVNPDKCEFGKRSMEFFGHVFSASGISAHKSKVDCLIHTDAPTNVSELRSFLGMAQYISRFLPSFSDIAAPLNTLLRKDVRWKWQAEQQHAFMVFKEKLQDIRTLAYFDTGLYTELLVDASPVGLSGILTQRTHAGAETVHVVCYASRSLTPVEKNYSQTEREALAVCWAIQHFFLYLYGCDEFTVVTDCKPLLGIFNNPNCHTNTRIERMCLRVQAYKFNLIYRKGASNTADYLSRHPKPESANAIPWLEEEIKNVCINAINMYENSVSLADIRAATDRDSVLQKVMANVQNNTWSAESKDVQPFKQVCAELCVAAGLLLRGNRVVIPETLKSKVVKQAHSSHQGVVKTKAFLRETVWFPGIDKLVEEEVANCLPCQTTVKQDTLEPLKMSPLPSAPWEEISADFLGPFQNGDYLLVVMDDYSRFPECEFLRSTSFQATAPKLDAIFSRHGFPSVLKTDNGPPWNGKEMKEWACNTGFLHRKITPLWPRANAECERFMRTLKKYIQVAIQEKGSYKEDLQMFLRHYRATPHSTTGLSPAEALYGRKIRSAMPFVADGKRVRFKDKVELMKEKDARMKAAMKKLADARNKARESDIDIGDTVLVKQTQTGKTVPVYKPTPYVVVDRNGSMLSAENTDGHRITRNSSFYKQSVDTSEFCANLDKEANVENPSVDKLEIPKLEDAAIELPPRRSERMKRFPTKYDDYICT